MVDVPSCAKWSYITRCVDTPGEFRLGVPAPQPRLGDLMVARVAGLGNHKHLELPDGRRCRLYPGDVVVGACGNRYASDYYEGYLGPGPALHLLTAGGVLGIVASTHARYAEPTVLEVIGALADVRGAPLSLEQFTRSKAPSRAPRLGTLVVVGSAMNAGKTTTAAAIVRGWAQAGLKPGAGKVTGSGSGKDRWSYIDAGATQVCDFLEFGMCSTFGYPVERLRHTMTVIRDALVNDGADAVVLEIADGLLQSETSALVADLHEIADGVVLAVADPLAAKAGSEMLRQRGVPLLAVSGLVSASPLAAREVVESTGLPVLTPEQLAGGAAMDLLCSLERVA